MPLVGALRMNLLTKILFWMFPVALPVMGFTWSYYHVQLDASAEQIGNISSLASTSGAQRLNDFLRLRVSEFELLGSSINSCDNVGNTDNFVLSVRNVLQQSQGFSALIIADEKGKVDISLTARASSSQSELPHSLQGSWLFDAWHFEHIDALFQRWRDDLPELQRQKNELFMQALEMERRGDANSVDYRRLQNRIFRLTSHIARPPIHIDYAGGREAALLGLLFERDTFLFTQPLLSCDGNLKGYVTAFLDRSKIDDILNDLRNSLADRGIHSVDVVLLRNNPLRFESDYRYLSVAALQESGLPSGAFRHQFDGFVASAPVADEQVLNQLMEQVSTTTLNVSAAEYQNSINQLSSLSLLVFIADHGWREGGKKLLLEASTWLLVSMFLLFVLVFMLAQNIVAPVVRLKQSVDKVEAGDLSVKAEVSSSDEIGQLASAFNRMTNALQRSEDKLTRLAREDALTGLMNRRALNEEAIKERHRAQRLNTTIAIAMIDLDHFKEINDRYGHAAGDWVLKEFARIMQGVLRKTDLFSRIGGEEFVLLLPDTDLSTAHKLVETLLISVQQSQIALENGAVVQLTFSAGVVTWPEDCGIDEVLHQADEKLYQAKLTGRNQVVS
ncbi:diguanylate cyclase [Amphritea pacifica]|uniref:diguanylate cyclase n=1 Tax=Amphritea pacifica TaxID=2811233 RepID=A0ABS2W4F7_9GAMM|nr:GGDEF domain-containing protein [Amphritea pacifica]MBN0986590.1 diguanylate cyclase [Amphritea pacifica]